MSKILIPRTDKNKIIVVVKLNHSCFGLLIEIKMHNIMVEMNDSAEYI